MIPSPVCDLVVVYWNNLSTYIEANKCLVNLKVSFYWCVDVCGVMGI